MTTVNLSAWLSSYQREQYVEPFKHMKEKHTFIMNTLFSDHMKSTDEHMKKLEAEYSTAFNYDVIDPGDVYEMIHEKAFQFYESEVLMEHNFHLLLLSNIYQIFEQQLRSFMYSTFNHKFSPVSTGPLKKFGLNMNELKDAFNHLDYDLTTNPHWNAIYTLSDIVNTFKHGDGRSAKRLHTTNPSFFKVDSNNHRIMDSEFTTNSAPVFDLNEIPFDNYADAIISFWNTVPEHLSGTYTFTP